MKARGSPTVDRPREGQRAGMVIFRQAARRSAGGGSLAIRFSRRFSRASKLIGMGRPTLSARISSSTSSWSGGLWVSSWESDTVSWADLVAKSDRSS